MRPVKWISLMLALCLLASLFTTALTEEQVPSPELDAQVSPAQGVDEATGLTVDSGDMAEESEISEAPVAADGEAGESGDSHAVAGPESPMRYAEVLTESAPVYARAADWDVAALLNAGDVILVTGEAEGRAAVAFNGGGSVLSGFMEAADIAVMDEARTAARLDAAAASGEVALYAGDLNWPLPPLADAVWGEGLAVMANYSEYSNDTMYTMNGVQVCASMVPDPGSGRCWTYAQGIYQKVWGCRFSENFKGNESTGMNLLRNLNDAQRRLTPAHLKAFILRTQPGATIRVCGCTTACGSFNNDGLGCGHKGHSLIVVDHNEDGLVTMDSHSNSQHTRFYTWQGFCNSWNSSSYPCPYIKYIKWPGAPAIASSEISEDGTAEIHVTGVSLDAAELTVEVGSKATLTATVAPADATRKGVSWASGDSSVATVSDGVVTGIKAGKTAIAVRTADGDKTATCSVTVVIPVAKKALTKTGGNGTITLAPGDKLQLTADFATKKGWKLKSVKSSKSKYASVDGSGLVTANAEGKAKITVTTTNKKKATVTIKVVDSTKPKSVAIKQGKTATLYLGQTLQLTAALSPSSAQTALAWASSKSKVATVDANGLVTPVGEGTVKIGVVTQNKKKATITIKVVDPNKPTKVVLNKSGTVKMKVGGTLKLQSAVQPSTATTKLTWKSSNAKIAAVDADGNVKALKKGSCYVGVVTDNGKYAKVKIKVSK